MLVPEPGLMIWTLITFGVAVLVLTLFAFKPLQKALDARRQSIQDSMDAAEETRVEALRLLEEYKSTLARVRGESEEILERSRATAEHAKAEIIAEAKAQSDRILQKAGEQVERDTRAALRDIRSQIAELTALATEKVAAGSLNADDQRRLIDEALAELNVDKLGTEAQG
jgi:F-type H+-transporting ATPase subunit b